MAVGEERFNMKDFKPNKIRQRRLSSEEEFSVVDLIEGSLELLKKQFPSLHFEMESEQELFKQGAIDSEKFFYLLYYVVETMIFDFQVHKEIQINVKRTLLDGKRGMHILLHSLVACTLEQVNHRVFEVASLGNKVASVGLSSCQLAHATAQQLGGKLHFEYGVNEPLVIYLQL